MPNPGDAITLSLQLGNGDISKFPLAHVYNGVGVEVSGSPFSLASVARGLYTHAAALTMPSNTDELKVQYICYDDAGHTTPSTDQPLTADVFRSSAPVDTKVNLTLQLFDGNVGKFPLVHVYDNTGAELSGSPVALTHIARGLYYDKSLNLPSNWLEIIAQYQVFDDSGHTTPTAGESINIDEILPLGANSTDPGAANVRSGVTYTFNNVLQTGTYKGSGFNSDPGVGNVSAGVNYEILGQNLTGTRQVVTNYIAQATLSGPPNQAAILKAENDD